jgi:DNA-directed RNA polymerase subunit RPC12/RpoP
MKQYDKELYKKVFTRGDNFVDGGFPIRCPECLGNLNKNGDFNYVNDWTASYTCSKCGIKYAYQPSDMGQSSPLLEQYKDKDKLFKK